MGNVLIEKKVSDIISATKSTLTSELYLKNYEKFLKTVEKDVRTLDFNDCIFWVKRLKEEGLKINTINTKISILKSIFSSFKKTGIIINNPFEILKKFKEDRLPSTKALSITDIKNLLSVIDNERDYAIISLLLMTGCRVSEICSIKWSDIYMEDDYYLIKILGKGNKERIVKLSKEIYNIIPKNDYEHIFVSERGNRVSPLLIDRTIKKYARKASIQHISAHTFRHTYITNAYANGVDIFRLQQAVGHNSVEMTRRYTHIDDIIKNNPSDKLSYKDLINGHI